MATIGNQQPERPGVEPRARGNLRAVKRGVLYVVGAVITAFIGWWINEAFSKADLKVYLTSAGIDSPTRDAQEYEASLREEQGLYGYGSSYPRNASLEGISEESVWLGTVRTDTFDNYLLRVNTARRDAGIA